MYSRYIRQITPINYLFKTIKLNRHMSSSLPDLSLTNYSFCNITDACAQRLEQLVKKKSALDLLHLRISVDSGGCSGFQYNMTIEPNSCIQPTDIIQRHHLISSAIIVTDEESINFLKGCTINYVSEIIRSGFMVTENNIAESACGCGSSFALKNFNSNK